MRRKPPLYGRRRSASVHLPSLFGLLVFTPRMNNQPSNTAPSNAAEVLLRNVIEPGLCTGCGACVAITADRDVFMQDTPRGPQPCINGKQLPEEAVRICPAYRLSYPELYRNHYGSVPGAWLLGHYVKVRTGHASDPEIRRLGASGGTITATLCHLLESGEVDAVLAVRQGA